MRYLALACDYDGTLAEKGRVAPETVDALKQCRATGRKLVLVTGRILEDLESVFPATPLFHWIVAENGAQLYQPSTGREKLLASRPPERFIRALEARQVPLGIGKVIIGTERPYEVTVLDTIRQEGVELEIIFNKESVMILPTGINKATGLTAALAEMELKPEQLVGVGDAENDHAFLKLCGCSAAVANAIPALKEAADLVTQGPRGRGVVELIQHLLANDLADVTRRR